MKIQAPKWQVHWRVAAVVTLLCLAALSKSTGLTVFLCILSSIALLSAILLKNETLSLTDELFVYKRALRSKVTIRKSDIAAIDLPQIPVFNARMIGDTKPYLGIRLVETCDLSRNTKHQENFQKFNYHIFFEGIAGHSSDRVHTILNQWLKTKSRKKRF